MSTPSHADLLREYLELLSQPGGESRLPAWREWFKLRVGGLAVGAVLALTGCDDSDTGYGGTGGSGGGASGASQTQPGAGGTSTTPPATTGGTSATSTATGGIGQGTLYGVPMTSTGGFSAGPKYGVPITTRGGSSNIGGTKYGVPISTTAVTGGASNASSVASGGSINTGSAVAIYAIVMGGTTSQSSAATGGRSNTTIPMSAVTEYGVIMAGGVGNVTTNPGVRYGVPAPTTGGNSSKTSTSQATGGAAIGLLYGIPFEK